ncbi:VanZ family protein [Salinibius halmophilus]|uniref:VanZ family protein n=1 Tax=Salinibius halmophilus TaxID=1853216 RepID=UPI000E670602|nr:VanZ family protein [Salinibius halmophilus]
MVKHAFGALATLASLVILIASLWPASGPATGNDKIDHLLAYGALMLLWYLYFRSHTLTKLAIIWLGVVAYGGIIEFLQGLTSYRFASIADMIANSAGAGLMLLLILGWLRIRKPQ